MTAIAAAILFLVSAFIGDSLPFEQAAFRGAQMRDFRTDSRSDSILIAGVVTGMIAVVSHPQVGTRFPLRPVHRVSTSRTSDKNAPIQEFCAL
ncbi:hypothetical protein ACFUTV_40250 [Streptomyces sp. NPDC057298]|uniref:hypothetical protein n=1 Tax=Streptomyces sp. NPDC057298 TaxID=3346091 RepID=UPI00362C9D7D